MCKIIKRERDAKEAAECAVLVSTDYCTVYAKLWASKTVYIVLILYQLYSSTYNGEQGTEGELVAPRGGGYPTLPKGLLVSELRAGHVKCVKTLASGGGRSL